jgi:hypothetical protein
MENAEERKTERGDQWSLKRICGVFGRRVGRRAVIKAKRSEGSITEKASEATISKWGDGRD